MRPFPSRVSSKLHRKRAFTILPASDTPKAAPQAGRQLARVFRNSQRGRGLMMQNFVRSRTRGHSSRQAGCKPALLLLASALCLTVAKVRCSCFNRHEPQLRARQR